MSSYAITGACILIKSLLVFQFVLVTDDENRENEGDLIMAGSEVTLEDMAFLVKHSTGIVCVAMKGEDLDRLQLPLMVPQRQNKESHRTAFTVTVVCFFIHLRDHDVQASELEWGLNAYILMF